MERIKSAITGPDAFFISMVVTMWIVGMLILLSTSMYRLGYKDGQIHAATGTICYELQENDDLTRSWVNVCK